MQNDDNYAFLIDMVNVISFIIGIQNLNENNKQTASLEEHLKKQDEQYNKIIELIKDMKGGIS